MTGKGKEETICGTMVRHKTSCRDHSVLTQLLTRLKIEEWRTRIFQHKEKITLFSVIRTRKSGKEHEKEEDMDQPKTRGQVHLLWIREAR